MSTFLMLCTLQTQNLSVQYRYNIIIKKDILGHHCCNLWVKQQVLAHISSKNAVFALCIPP